MAGVGEQSDLQILSERRDLVEANLDPTSIPAVVNISIQDVRTLLQQPVLHWQPSIEVSYRDWELRDPVQASWSPVRLFLLFFQCILDQLVYHTNINAKRNLNRKQSWKEVTNIEMRRWLACRLQMIKITPVTTSMESMWSIQDLPTRKIGYQRFKAIERYLSVCSNNIPDKEHTLWFWKVQNALDLVRSRLKTTLIPGSHLTVDESSIKFHGRQKDKYRMKHKPAGEGFCVYALCSHGGLLHDFIISSSREGLEGVPEGIEIDIPTRSVRKRKRGSNNDQALLITLPPQKAVVYTLCERVTTEWRHQTFVCYIDNLFVDIPLARAPLTLNIGMCGTTRTNTPGFPPILLAIKHKYGSELRENEHTALVIDNIAVCMVWKDHERGNIVSFISTVHSPYYSEAVIRRTRPKNRTRKTPGGFTATKTSQPRIAVDYNQYMGNTDLHNRLRASKTIRRPHQAKWTKKFIEFIIDICHSNAFIIWKRYQVHIPLNRRHRERFLTELIEGLIEVVEDIHLPVRGQKRSYCAWEGCQTREYDRRDILGEVINSTTSSRSSRVDSYCNDCMKYLCTGKACWGQYHDARGLIIRSEDRH